MPRRITATEMIQQQTEPDLELEAQMAAARERFWDGLLDELLRQWDAAMGGPSRGRLTNSRP